MVIVDKTWFTLRTGQCIGIVVIVNKVGERKAYIGIGQGRDEDYDSKMIATSGSPVKIEALESLLKKLKGD